MNVDIHHDILFSHNQKKRKKTWHKCNALTKKLIAEEEDEQLYLSWIKPSHKDPFDYSLHDKKKWGGLIKNQEDESSEYTSLNYVDLSLDKNGMMIVDDVEKILNNNCDDNNGDFNTDKFTGELLIDDYENLRLESLNDDYENSFSESLTDDYEHLRVESPLLLHQFTSVSTKSYCIELLKLLREANACKSHSKRFVELIKSILPIPHNFPSTYDHLISSLNIENLFVKRTVCLICKSNIHFQEKKCLTCHVTDKKMQADIYDVDIKKVLKGILKRLSCSIEEYKEKILNGIDVHGTQDVPFGVLYKNLLDQFAAENIISLILHLDGIPITKSTGLKMWLFSGAFVELPAILRYRRHNMILLSIWIGYVEPNPDIWLKSVINELDEIKKQDIHIKEHLNYKLKIFSITGDCPALARILNVTQHGGYNCCFYCYIEGEHIENKRQYKYQSPLVLRRAHSYLQQSLMARDNKIKVLGHKGVSVLQTILDVPLPKSILIDYLHVSLLGHAKACILSLYQCLTPIERIELDQKLIQQQFPHYFNRKMRRIAKFANVKGNEIKNILLYGFLPNFQSYLSIERLSHFALYICFLRLLHGAPVLGPETPIIADNLFQLFYRDHDNYFDGLQNLVLHLHAHMVTVYKYYGSLSNIGCFGQEDLIGKIGTNHHGSRYHGELITFYYNIDYSLHNKSSTSLTITHQPYDLVLDSPVQNDSLHKQLCDCGQVHDCFRIYRRFTIHQQMYHSLLYNKRGHSVSYFVQYFLDQMGPKFGTIEFFVTIESQNKSYACISEYRIQQQYSSYFKDSKYFHVLKKPLDVFFFVLENHPSGRDFVCIELIKKHCIVFQMNNFKIVTPISTYNEHD